MFKLVSPKLFQGQLFVKTITSEIGSAKFKRNASSKSKAGSNKTKVCGSIGKGKKEDSKSKKQCSSPSKSERDDSKPKKQCSSGGKSEKEGEKSEKSETGDVPRIAINGFGRIGRMALRIAVEHSCPLEIVAINDPMMTPAYMAYLLKYDSTHGRFVGDVEVDGNQLIVDGKSISTYNKTDPKDMPWKSVGVDYVIESSGKLTSAKKAEGHLTSGAKKVVITAPSSDAPMYVIGVNLDDYDCDKKVVSCASCATNALAPMAKVVHDNFQIIEGIMTTVHAVTASQKIIDSPSQKNWRESRGGLQNMIPTATGAAKAVGKVIPDLMGKMTALSIRVPTANVSLVDLTCRLNKETSIDEIRCALCDAMEGPMMGIIDVTDEEVVSSDFNGSHFSCIFDSKASIALNKKFVKLIAWFDNEYGYTCRVIDLIKFMHVEEKSQE